MYDGDGASSAEDSVDMPLDSEAGFHQEHPGDISLDSAWSILSPARKGPRSRIPQHHVQSTSSAASFQGSPARVKLVPLSLVLPTPFSALVGWPTAQTFGARGKTASFLSDYVDELPDWVAIIDTLIRAPITKADHLARHGRLTVEIHSFFRGLEWVPPQVHGRPKQSVSRRTSKTSIRAEKRFVSNTSLRDQDLLVLASSREYSQLTLSIALLCVRITEAIGGIRRAGSVDTASQVACLSHSALIAASLLGTEVDLMEKAEEYVEAQLSKEALRIEQVRKDGNALFGRTKSKARSGITAFFESQCEDPQACYGHLLYMLTLANPANPEADEPNPSISLALLDPSLDLGESASAILLDVADRFGLSHPTRQLEEFRLILHGFTHSSRCYTWARRMLGAMKVQSTLASWTTVQSSKAQPLPSAPHP